MATADNETLPKDAERTIKRMMRKTRGYAVSAIRKSGHSETLTYAEKFDPDFGSDLGRW
jgi:hypothetical protein